MRARLSAQPGWLLALELYVVSRLVSTVLLAAVFAVATSTGIEFASHRAHPDFFTFSGSWDASSYRAIAETGYPRVLPRDGAGAVLPNVWAFLPVYPQLVQVIASGTGLGFYAAGALVSALCGAGATVALYLLLRPNRGRRGSLWAVTLFAFGPLSFVLQTAYAESLFLLLAFACLLFADRGRYALATVVGVLAAFTRPGALALAAAIGILAIIALVRRDPFPAPRRRVGAFAAAILIGIAGLSWPFVAGWVTGESGAYLQSELAFWTPLLGRGSSFVPGTPWFLLAFTYLGGIGVILVLVILALVVLWLRRRRLRTVGALAYTYSIAYAVYLVAVFLPQQSVLRLMLPLAPLLGDPALDRGRRFRTVVLAALVPLQLAAIILLWFLSFP
ncbi:hypothetical protein BH11ACT2_BH11ACT2_14520 [soil metagenome]